MSCQVIKSAKSKAHQDSLQKLLHWPGKLCLSRAEMITHKDLKNLGSPNPATPPPPAAKTKPCPLSNQASGVVHEDEPKRPHLAPLQEEANYLYPPILIIYIIKVCN